MPIIKEIITGAVRSGANLNLLCNAIGVELESLNQSEKFVDFETAHRTWIESVKQSGDKLLGLHIGQYVNPTMIGLTGHLMQTSSTLKVALDHVCKFNELFTDMFFYSLEQKGNSIAFRIEPAKQWIAVYPDSAYQARDQAASGVLRVCELLVGKKIIPSQIHLNNKQTKDAIEYERILGCSVAFNQNENAVVFLKDQLEEQVLTRDHTLFNTFQNLLNAKLSATKAKSMKSHIIYLIEMVYGLKPPTLSEVASQLNTTPRSLQRKLEDESTSYREVVEEFRASLAKKLIKKNTRIKTVAALLGYSDASTFRKAFKNWINESPKSYRNRKP